MVLTLTACSGSNGSHGCVEASTGDPDTFEQCDPWQPVNEQVFSFNLFTDRWITGPIAHTYHEVPKDGRVAVDHFLTNLGEPHNMVNGALQGDMLATTTSLWRFLLNSTFGLGGLRDFAGENGLKYQDQSFGKTLQSYGIDDGPYLVVPIAGPSNIRDTTGMVVDWFLDPVGWSSVSIAQDVADGINERDQDNAIIEQYYYRSLEPYSATRAAYLQHQAFHH